MRLIQTRPRLSRRDVLKAGGAGLLAMQILPGGLVTGRAWAAAPAAVSAETYAALVQISRDLGWPLEPSRSGFLPDSVQRWFPFKETNPALVFDRLFGEKRTDVRAPVVAHAEVDHTRTFPRGGGNEVERLE